MRHLVAFVIAFALLVSACSNGDAEPPLVSTTNQATVASPTTTTTPPAEPAVPAGPGRLVIVDPSGNVALVDPDGANLEVITDDANASAIYFQPTWSPDARSLAFSLASSASSGVVIHELATGTTDRIETAFPAFYFSWARESDRLAFLGNAAGGGLQLSVVDRSAAPLRSDRGQPYYFSWGPDGSMVVHVGVDRLETLDAEGSRQERELGDPGIFRTPQWLDRGIFYLERIDGVGRLVLDTGDGAATLAEVSGGASFVVSPDGNRVAIQAVEAVPEGELAFNAAFAVAQAAPRLPANRLVVLDVDTLDWSRVTNEPVLAYSWSPDGARLLVLTVPDPTAPELTWQVWEDGDLGNPITFVPTPTLFRDVLPFFDQYTQSLQFWSPDSSSFTFPGAVDGEPGIFVVDVDGAGDPVKVAEGSWVSWSPK